MQSQNRSNIPVRIVKNDVGQRREYHQEIPQAQNQRTTYNHQVTTRVEPQQQRHTTTNNLTGDVSRQAAVNTAVKTNVQSQVPQRQYRGNYNTNPNSNSNIYQSQGSSRQGRVYHHEVSSRREYQRGTEARREQRGRIVSSVDSNLQYRQIQNETSQNRVYVSGSGSPGNRRIERNTNIQESVYNSNLRGGIVKLRRWKYTSQTEINKIITIQRWWRYMYLVRKEQRQSRYSESSEPNSENLVEYTGENERYGHYGNGYGYGEEENIRTKTRVKRNAKEKIIAGTKSRYIVETTTIEVFKNQNTVLKKVEPEVLTKETKKIKRKSIKEQMMEIWERENVQYNTANLSILSEGVSVQTQEIIEEYEVNIKELKTFLSKKEEEMIELTEKLKTYEMKKNYNNLNMEAVELEILSTKPKWNQIIKEKKESKINIRGKTKIFTEIEIIEMLYKLRKPFEIN